MLARLENGTHPNPKLQQAWNQVDGSRRFTFHTRNDLLHDSQFLGRPQFLADVGMDQKSSSAKV